MFKTTMITPQKAGAICKKLGTTIKEFKKYTFSGYAEMCLPSGGKLKHHQDYGYWTLSYSAGDCTL